MSSVPAHEIYYCPAMSLFAYRCDSALYGYLNSRRVYGYDLGDFQRSILVHPNYEWWITVPIHDHDGPMVNALAFGYRAMYETYAHSDGTLSRRPYHHTQKAEWETTPLKVHTISELFVVTRRPQLHLHSTTIPTFDTINGMHLTFLKEAYPDHEAYTPACIVLMLREYMRRYTPRHDSGRRPRTLDTAAVNRLIAELDAEESDSSDVDNSLDFDIEPYADDSELDDAVAEPDVPVETLEVIKPRVPANSRLLPKKKQD